MTTITTFLLMIYSTTLNSMLKYSQSNAYVDSNKLNRIYSIVTKPPRMKYKPIRTHYNIHLFG